MLTEQTDSPTKTLFDCLAKLYRQGQLLLMDADRLMGERGWEPRHTSAAHGFSNSLNSPDRWYARWATRFYQPTVPEGEEITIDRLLFVSIHFASDHDSKVDEPIVSAGRLLYGKPMSVKAAGDNYDYWMCKYWFYGTPPETLDGWHQTKQARLYENLKGTETFIVPLYKVTSSDELQKLVIDQLLSPEEQA